MNPKKIAQMLGQSLPALPDQAVRQVGATLDELTAFGERIARREAALTGLTALARVYRQYAAGVTTVRARTLVDASNAHAAAAREHTRRVAELAELSAGLESERAAQRNAHLGQETAGATLRELERSPGANRRRELELQQQDAKNLARSATELVQRLTADQRRSADSTATAQESGHQLSREQAGLIAQT